MVLSPRDIQGSPGSHTALPLAGPHSLDHPCSLSRKTNFVHLEGLMTQPLYLLLKPQAKRKVIRPRHMHEWMLQRGQGGYIMTAVVSMCMIMPTFRCLPVRYMGGNESLSHANEELWYQELEIQHHKILHNLVARRHIPKTCSTTSVDSNVTREKWLAN